jgi:hypothetical protein
LVRQKDSVTSVFFFFQELELEKEKTEEATEMLEKQQHNLMRLPDLEREVASLRDENRNLRFVLSFISCFVSSLMFYLIILSGVKSI